MADWARGQVEDRFDTSGCESTMKAVVTTGNGGYDKLEYRDVPVPALGPGEVLLQVLAAGVNNTEINTRLGWYSSSVTTGTESRGSSCPSPWRASSMASPKPVDSALISPDRSPAMALPPAS